MHGALLPPLIKASAVVGRPFLHPSPAGGSHAALCHGPFMPRGYLFFNLRRVPPKCRCLPELQGLGGRLLRADRCEETARLPESRASFGHREGGSGTVAYGDLGPEGWQRQSPALGVEPGDLEPLVRTSSGRGVVKAAKFQPGGTF